MSFLSFFTTSPYLSQTNTILLSIPGAIVGWSIGNWQILLLSCPPGFCQIQAGKSLSQGNFEMTTTGIFSPASFLCSPPGLQVGPLCGEIKDR